MKPETVNVEVDSQNLRRNVSRLLAAKKTHAAAYALGTNVSTVNRWKLGNRTIDSAHLPALARYLKVSIDDLYAPIDPE